MKGVCQSLPKTLEEHRQHSKRDPGTIQKHSGTSVETVILHFCLVPRLARKMVGITLQ